MKFNKKVLGALALTMGLCFSGATEVLGVDSILGLDTHTVEASSTKQVQTTTNLNVRQSTSTKSKVLTVAKKGTKLSVISTSGNWYKVKVNGKTGWVSKSYTKAVSTAKATTATTAKVATTSSAKQVQTTTNLNVRQSTSTKSKVLAVAKKGTKLNVIKTSGDWYQVKVNGKTGWISKGYTKAVSASNTGTTASSNAKTTSNTATPKIGTNKIGMNGHYVSYRNVGGNNTAQIQKVINSGTVSASVTSFNGNDGQTTYFSGHNPGIFNNLSKNIKKGAIIHVSDSNGKVFNYKVTDHVNVTTSGSGTLGTIGKRAVDVYAYGSGQESIAIQYCNIGRSDMSVWYAVKQ